MIPLKTDYKQISFSVIIPSKTIAELIRIFSESEEKIKMIIEKNQIGFESSKTELVSRLIEGNYPDYKKLIPIDFNTTVRVNKENFLKTIKLVSLLSGRINDIKLSFLKSQNSKLVFYAGDSDLGENDSEMPVDINGENLDIKFNWKYLVDGVAGIQGDEISLNFIDEHKPCLIKSPQDNNFLYLVMPIRA